jgi:hypothetical protein
MDSIYTYFRIIYKENTTLKKSEPTPTNIFIENMYENYVFNSILSIIIN